MNPANRVTVPSDDSGVRTLSQPTAVAEASRRFFPGWLMLGISAAAQFMSGPGQSYSVAAFKEPMRSGLGLSETNYSLAYGIATLVSGIALPVTGRLLDRIGGRRLLPLAAALLAVACVVISQVETLVGLYFGFALIRCLGQGALTLIGTWIVGEWFLRRRGLATALSGLGSSTSVIAFPILNGWLIQTLGWRGAWQVLAALVAATMVVPAWLLLRDRPEELGLQPDGDAPPQALGDGSRGATMSSTTAEQEDSWHVSEVLRDATFWKLLSVPVCTGMIGTGLVFHQVSILGARGISAQAALSLISLQATVATLAALVAGWLTDLWRTERLLAIAMAMLSSAIVILLVVPHPRVGYAYAVLLGIHGSILRSAGTVVWVNYYGRANQGAIRGASLSMMILAAAVGPLPLAIAHDRFGDYTPALALFAVFPALAACLVLTAKRPIRAAR